MATPEIDAVLADLEVVVSGARARRDRVGFFAALYRQMTRAVKDAVEAGAFDDGPRMERLVSVFASRYLEAVRTSEAGGTPSRSWRVALETARRPDRVILQHLILGINAHINLDLGVAAAQVCPGDAILDLEGDFDRINRTIATLVDPVQQAIGRFSPLLRLLWAVGGTTDDQVLNFSFRVAREEAWTQALTMARQNDDDRARFIASVDRKVALLGRLVANPVGIVDKAMVGIVRLSESGDVVAIIDALGAVVVPRPSR